MDAALAEPVGILIIGGSEPALGYGVNIITRDIDTSVSGPPGPMEIDLLAATGAFLIVPKPHSTVTFSVGVPSRCGACSTPSASYACWTASAR